jgi:Tol biopolymer transport system component
MARYGNGNTDIWFLETGRGLLRRFTSDPTFNNNPVWSPDGNRIIFASNRKGTYNIYEKPSTGPSNGPSDETLLLETEQLKNPMDWSRDGRYLLYGIDDQKAGRHLWALPLFGDRQPFPVVQTNFNEREGQFSPDGKWIAYTSDETGRFEIYVQSFPRRQKKPGCPIMVALNLAGALMAKNCFISISTIG